MLKRFLLWIVLLPFQMLLVALFALADVVHLFCNAFRRGDPAGRPSGSNAASGDARATRRVAPTKAKVATSAEVPTGAVRGDLCSIVIVNWNGRHLLEESLPALQRAIASTGKSHEVIVVDNASTDDSLAWLETHFPRVRVLTLEENLGFGAGNNRGVEAARHGIVVLLNNDMIVREDFLPPLLDAFADPDVFAASSQIFFPSEKRREETGNTQGRWRWGRLELSHEPVHPYHCKRRYLPVLWAGGGSSAFHRSRFQQLGGFSSLFSPCYLEDTDLCYRAWRRGWKSVLAAQSGVLHKHRSSSAVRFEPRALDEMIEERRLWYVWKNYELRTLLWHLIFLPLHFKLPGYTATYIKSLYNLHQVIQLRLSEPARACSDRELFHWIRFPLLYLNRFHPDRRPPRSGPLKILTVSAYLPHLGQHGGAGRVFQLLRQVARQHEVSVVSFIETEEEARQAEQLIPCCRRVETVLRRAHRPVSPFPYEPFEEFNCPDFRDRLTRVLLEEDFDLVHFEWTQMAQYADLVPQLPKLVTEVEVNYAAHHSQVRYESHLLRKTRKFYNTLQTFYRELELCGRVDRVVCVTETDRAYLDGYLDSQKLSVINTGVDVEFFDGSPKQEPDPDTLVYVGAFRHEPNVDAMRYFCQDVFPLILRERPQTRLWIVGSSPPPSIRTLEQESQITVTGFVEDIREYYRRAQVVVVPVRTGVGIRGKILEAWAARKAVVATSVACMGMRAGHGQNILIADRPEEFALWTLALLRHPEHCRRLAEAGHRTAREHYDWPALGRQMIQVYEEMARNPGRSV